MNTAVTWDTDCNDVQQSLDLAEKLGRMLHGQEVIELVSDLGGGKTTFVRGLARGIGSNELLSSPTFTLSNIYRGAALTIHHYDFYRLGEAGILGDELQETLTDPTAVTVIEWAGIVNDTIPTERLTIHITATGESSRHYALSASGPAASLLKELAA